MKTIILRPLCDDTVPLCKYLLHTHTSFFVALLEAIQYASVAAAFGAVVLLFVTGFIDGT